LLGGFIAAQVLLVVAVAIWAALGGDYNNDKAFLVMASAVQEVIFVVAAVAIARTSGRVTMRDFGLVRAPFWPTFGKAAAVIFSYFVILAAYSSVVHLTSDDAPRKLGADSGQLGMLAFALLVAVLAPIAEELFFRGMVFRSLANKLGVWGGAIVSGLIFGAFHIDSLAQSRLLQVVPLAVLGVLFAVLYAWSGTIYSTIALHATNNALAVAVYAHQQHSNFGIVLAGCIWLAMITGCVVGWRFTDRGGEPPELPEPPDAPVAAVPAPQHPTLVAPERPTPFPQLPPRQ
jgi:membrane protease YdiL (CAAX protease family)